MSNSRKKIRYAVIGTGWFAQEAVLPGFHNANNSELVAIFSGDPVKRDLVGKKYSVQAYPYEDYNSVLEQGGIDAVYIVTPNALHKEYGVRAAERKVHVLCEKPLAANSSDCQDMIDTCEENGVKLMTAYRLHFESANLKVMEMLRQGTIGDLRLFHGMNTQSVEEGNTRLSADLGGSPLLDVGIYCINAARYLFQDDPIEVMGFDASNGETRFSEVPEMVSAMMRFPRERLAVFSCGFGESKVSAYRVVGTTGDIRMDPAYAFSADLNVFVTQVGKTEETRYRQRDQVGAEILYFSDCILNNRNPEPDGYEGLADLFIIEGIEKAIRNKKSILLDPFKRKPRPSPDQEIRLSATKAPKLVNASPPSG
jgi:predicted dehydrogenase